MGSEMCIRDSAGGQRCPTMVNQGCCPYSHAQQPVPWGAYARIERKPSAARSKHDVMALEEEELTIAIEQLQHAKSALNDAPTADDFSEADALSLD